MFPLKFVFLHCVVSTEKKESKETTAAEKVEEDPEGEFILNYKNLHHLNYYFKCAAVY